MAKHDGMNEISLVWGRLRSTLMSAGVTLEDLLATLPEARERVFNRHYGDKPKHAAPPRRGTARKK